MRNFLLLSLIYAISLAAYSQPIVTNNNNRRIYAIACAHNPKDVTNCYKKANQICADGYIILDKYPPTHPLPVQPLKLQVAHTTKSERIDFTYGITIQCKDPIYNQ